MSQFMQWLAMGGYSAYVWPAYGLVALVFLTNWLGMRFQALRIRKKLRQWLKRQAA